MSEITVEAQEAPSSQKMRDKYFTKKGQEMLQERMTVLLNLLEEKNYPIVKKMWGMPDLYIRNKQELMARIMEMKDWLMLLKMKINIKGDIDGGKL